MIEDGSLKAEETIEIGSEFKSMRKVFLRVIVISAIPLIVMGIAVFIITNIGFQDILVEVINEELVMAPFDAALRGEILEKMRSAATIRILWVGLTVLVIGITVSLLCSIYIVGYIFRHFKDDENTNIRNVASKGQMEFMTLVSREIRDPVDSITVVSDRILEEETTPGIREKVLEIKESVNSMLVSFDSIYDYSRLEAGEIENEKEEYEITKLVKGCCSKAAPGIERKNLDFSVVYDESMPAYLNGDHKKIRKVLDNLLDNAVKYTYEGSIGLNIGFRTITPDKIDITFTVKDSGVGIRSDDAEKLFMPSGKMGYSKNVSIKGTGLGLLICKRLVSILDGRISVESEIGKGSTFRFTVPQDVINRKTVGECLRNDI